MKLLSSIAVLSFAYVQGAVAITTSPSNANNSTDSDVRDLRDRIIRQFALVAEHFHEAAATYTSFAHIYERLSREQHFKPSREPVDQIGQLTKLLSGKEQELALPQATMAAVLDEMKVQFRVEDRKEAKSREEP